MKDIKTVLKRYFGYDAFRSGQQEIVEKILQGEDVLAIMPTGAGKSICYQVPALLLEGVTVVLSPLISLMKDQVDTLSQAGVPAAYVNSSLTAGQLDAVMENAKRGAYKILYLAPERLETQGFAQMLPSLRVSMVAVDEAHCVSQWGHDFRPSYTKIAAMVALLPVRPVVAAFTATATPQVKQDIVNLLELRRPFLLTTGFDRKNLYFEVAKPKNKTAALLARLAKNRGKSCIIYASTRKTVDGLYEVLKKEGFSAARYHAGLSEQQRAENQEDFIYDRANLMVATNAFGMGIDKSNISCVIHYNMPKNIESYYQEAGRAGRDGEKAECILFYSASDIFTGKFLIENGGDQADKASEYQKLQDMVDYCNTDRCLRHYILHYFGEIDAAEQCGNCGNCNSDKERTDITVETQKILSCIKRMGERFGSGVVTAVLRGAHTAKIREMHFEKLSTYGIMKEYSADTIKELISFLVADGYIALAGEKYPVLTLGRPAYAVLHGGESVCIKRAIRKQEARSEESASADAGLFAVLREVRAKIAQEEKVPPYVVFSDAALHDMCRLCPTDAGRMLQVSGVGSVKLERYGAAFMAAIGAYVTENGMQAEIEPAPAPGKGAAQAPGAISDTKMASYALAQRGLTIDAIAKERGLTRGTVEGHLLSCFQNGMPVDSGLFVTEETERQILHAAELCKSKGLTPIKEALPDEISYTAIRFVLCKNARGGGSPLAG